MTNFMVALKAGQKADPVKVAADTRKEIITENASLVEKNG